MGARILEGGYPWHLSADNILDCRLHRNPKQNCNAAVGFNLIVSLSCVIRYLSSSHTVCVM